MDSVTRELSSSLADDLAKIDNAHSKDMDRYMSAFALASEKKRVADKNMAMATASMTSATNRRDKEKLAVIEETINKVVNRDFGVDHFDIDEVNILMSRIRNGKYDTTEHVLESYEDIAHLREYFRKFPVLERMKDAAMQLGFSELQVETEQEQDVTFISYGSKKQSDSIACGRVIWHTDDEYIRTFRDFRVNTNAEINSKYFAEYYDNCDKSVNAKLTGKLHGRKVVIARLSTTLSRITYDNIGQPSDKSCVEISTYRPAASFGINPPEIWIYGHGHMRVSIFTLLFGNTNIFGYSDYKFSMLNEFRIQAIKFSPEVALYTEKNTDDVVREYRSLGVTALWHGQQYCALSEGAMRQLITETYKNDLQLKYVMDAQYAEQVEREIRHVMRDSSNAVFHRESCTLTYDGCTEPLYLGDCTLNNLAHYLDNEVQSAAHRGSTKSYRVNIYPLTIDDITEDISTNLIGTTVSNLFTVNHIITDVMLCKSSRTEILVSGELYRTQVSHNYDTDNLYASIVYGKLDGFYFIRPK